MSNFLGKRATGCVTYLKKGMELVLGETGGLQQKWTDLTPLLIRGIHWRAEEQRRAYMLTDSRGNERLVGEEDLVNG